MTKFDPGAASEPGRDRLDRADAARDGRRDGRRRHRKLRRRRSSAGRGAAGHGIHARTLRRRLEHPTAIHSPGRHDRTTEVDAAIGTGFAQNPLVPDEVTWRFSASATRTVTTDGVPRTETVPLPAGELAFFTDGELSSTATRIDYLAKYPTQTNLQVSIEPTAPEYLEVGKAPDNIQPEYGFEVGRMPDPGNEPEKP